MHGSAYNFPKFARREEKEEDDKEASDLRQSRGISVWRASACSLNTAPFLCMKVTQIYIHPTNISIMTFLSVNAQQHYMCKDHLAECQHML